MPKFAANLTMLFNEVRVSRPLRRARRRPAFAASNISFPTPFPRSRWPSSSRGTVCLKCCTIFRPETGRRANGASPAFPDARGSSATASACDRLREGASGAVSSIALRASPRKDADREALRATLVGNLRYAAARAGERRRQAAGRAVNTYDIPGFYLNRTEQALALFSEVGERNLLAAIRHLSHAAHRRRTRGDHARSISIASRIFSSPTILAVTSRGRAKSIMTSCSASGSARLRRMDRLRVQAQDHHARGARLDEAVAALRVHARISRLKERAQWRKSDFIGLGVMGRPMAGHLLDAGPRSLYSWMAGTPCRTALLPRAPCAANPRRKSPRTPTSSSPWCRTRRMSRPFCSARTELRRA